ERLGFEFHQNQWKLVLEVSISRRTHGRRHTQNPAAWAHMTHLLETPSTFQRVAKDVHITNTHGTIGISTTI
ncbi:unnamed protein product, partial [Vitrella brassicaformis CCMP3155]